MPRSVDPADVRRWAELGVIGKTIAEIRKAHRERTGKQVDPRTIERALVKTQSEIAERTATAAELQRGIRVHGEQLLAGELASTGGSAVSAASATIAYFSGDNTLF